MGIVRSIKISYHLGVATAFFRHDESRIAALERLAEIARESPDDLLPSVERLYPLVRSSNPEIREKAIRCLSELARKNGEIVDPIDGDLDRIRSNDPDPAVRVAAERAVETSSEDGDDSVVPLAHETDAKTDREARSRTADLLSEAESNPLVARDSVDELRYFLGHKDVTVRAQAARALLHIALEFPSAVKPATGRLDHLLGESPEVAEPAMNAITTVSEEFPEELRGRTSKITLRLDNDDDEFRRYVALAITKMAVETPNEITHEVPTLVDHLDDSSQEVRKHLCRALGLIAFEYPLQVEQGVPELERRLTDRSSEVRRQAAFALRMVARGMPREVAPALESLVESLDDSFEEVRKEAVGAIAEIGATRARPSVRELYLNDPNEEVREAAEEALEELQTGSASDDHKPAAGSGRRWFDGGIDYVEFERDEAIGDSPTSQVYRATVDVGGGERSIAVKELTRPESGTTLDVEHLERFVSRMERWTAIDDHDHVVSLLDYSTEPVPWAAMEYLPNGDLSRLVGEVSLAEGVWIGTGIANAIRHAHRHGLVHLDVKPENVLLDRDRTPKLSDWGISKSLLDRSEGPSEFTPAYAAPEQLAPETYGKPDDSTDIYQVGSVVYELLTGVRPFERASTFADAVLSQEVVPATEHDPSLPDELDDVLGRALAKRKDNRYESVLLLRDDLEDL